LSADLGPDEWLGVEGAASNAVSGDLGEEAFDHVEPGRRAGCEVQLTDDSQISSDLRIWADEESRNEFRSVALIASDWSDWSGIGIRPRRWFGGRRSCFWQTMDTGDLTSGDPPDHLGGVRRRDCHEQAANRIPDFPQVTCRVSALFYLELSGYKAFPCNFKGFSSLWPTGGSAISKCPSSG
jgi:hypothetical protein